MSDELGIEDIPAAAPEPSVSFAPFGRPVTAEEVADRLSANLYVQLADGSDDTVRKAIGRSEIYAGQVLRRLGVAFDLEDQTIREVVLIYTVYELHIALGHEEAGREYRKKARDIILAAWGDFPDTDNAGPERAAAAAVVKPKGHVRS
ncbi:MAG: hypothetical protein LBD09_05590 [Treponema sp.]|nr:hypothetical protein [Treponema sp.]